MRLVKKDPLGARASRPHKAWHSDAYLPHFNQAGTAPFRVDCVKDVPGLYRSFSPKFLTHRQDNSFIFHHQSGILGCVAWEHPDELEGPLLQRGRLGQSLDARRVRFRGQSALMAGPRPHLRHQRLQALQR